MMPARDLMMVDDTTLMTARFALLAELRADVSDERVVNAIARVTREQFVPVGLRAQAYENRPLPIGEGQTISQPAIVAAMTEALQLTGAEKVLEIGTGSGYQAAVLSFLAREVVTVERLESLAESARKRLHALGYKNVRVYQAGEHLGYPPEAPYDAIIVTAAGPVVPQELIQQLAMGGPDDNTGRRAGFAGAVAGAARPARAAHRKEGRLPLCAVDWAGRLDCAGTQVGAVSELTG